MRNAAMEEKIYLVYLIILTNIWFDDEWLKLNNNKTGKNI